MARIRTILVDDHADFRRLAQVLLSELDSIELIALGENGEDAIRLCEQHRPELLLCDIAMPRMGGIEATRLIKAQEQPPVVALVSIYGDEEHRQQPQKRRLRPFPAHPLSAPRWRRSRRRFGHAPRPVRAGEHRVLPI